jgi:peptidoglycan/LPS O-acetylase OafA/YrhL
VALRRRPSRLWLFFWGRKRRGFPGLLVALLILAVVGAVLSRTPGAYDIGYWAGLILVVVLAAITLGAIVAALWGVLRQRGPR